MGIHVAALANINRDPKRRSTPWRPGDFMPYLVKEAVPPDRRALEKRLLATFGLKVDRRKLKKRKT